jgi:ribosomal protein L22
LLGFEQKALAIANDKDLRNSLRKVDKSIKEIPSEPMQQALTALLHSAQGDAIAFRRTAEQWFDDHMERVSGWYKRRIQLVLWILAIVVAVAINADSLQIAKRLWVEPSVRASLVNQAQTAANQPSGETNPSDELESLPVPLGWHLTTARDDPQGFPFYDDPGMAWDLLSKLLGLAITAVALTFGAPFWFDTLSKLARLRNSGAPPPASDAIRRGEGEETRRGESAAMATTLVEAAGESPETQAKGQRSATRKRQ